MIGPRMRGHLHGWLVVMLALTACADRTGVMLEVTRDEATVPAVDRLRFFVGVAVDQRYIDDGDPAEEVVLGEGRDVLDDPYVFLLTPDGTADGTELKAVVVGFQGDQVAGIGGAGPLTFLSGKVTSYPVMLTGNAGGSVVITQTGCLVWNDGQNRVVISSTGDRDCDGDPAATDCDDNNPAVGHGHAEVCANGIDDDCDGMKDEEEDADHDGVTNCTDCDDQNDQRYPGNPEICDGLDNDCNGICDDGELDGDNDKYTTCDRRILDDGTCSDANPALNDCDDTNPDVHPMAEEICDGIDNDCNDVCDDGFDPDNDLYTECGSRVDICDGVSSADIDCEPEEDRANPGILEESCDDLDNNCDGVFYPDSVPCYVKVNDGSGDTCQVGTRTCDDGNLGWVGDCVPPTPADAGVALEFCTAYEACQDAPDPWACANQMAVTTTYSCTVFYPSAQPDSVCTPAAARLPHPTIGDFLCQWTLAPARKRPHYDAVLAATDPLGVGGSATSAACQPLFVVRDTINNPPVQDSWLLHEEVENGDTQTFLIDLHPQAVTDCPVNGLQCVSALPPPN